MIRRLAVGVVLVALVAVSAKAEAGATAGGGDQGSVERQLIAAMAYSGVLQSRIIDPGTAIKAYIEAGYVARKPEQRRDYVDYRVLRKPASLLGHRLLVLEEEYLTEFMGCCVNPGVKATLEISGDDARLRAFATENRCRLSEETGREVLGWLNVQAAGRAVEISCGDRDAVDVAPR